MYAQWARNILSITEQGAWEPSMEDWELDLTDQTDQTDPPHQTDLTNPTDPTDLTDPTDPTHQKDMKVPQ